MTDPAEAIKQRVRAAAESYEPEIELERVWQEVTEVTTLINAKMLVLLTAKQLRAPEASPEAQRLFSEYQKDHEAVAHAMRLVTLFLEMFPGADVEVTSGPADAMSICLEDEVIWLVFPPRLPWPGTSTRAYFPRSREEVALEEQTFRLVDTLILRTKQALERLKP